MDMMKKRIHRIISVVLLTITLTAAGCFTAQPEVYAADVSLGGVWVVPEVISGARQPASGGMFAWVTFDYYYSGDSLAADLDTSAFTVQKKTIGGDWEDQTDIGLVVMGGEEVYIASFEAIVAAKIPENKDPFIKKWRLVYKKGTPEEIEGEVIVQAACLPETDDVTLFSKDYCADFRVEEAPWSYEEYQKDKVPPVYVAYVYPEVISTIREPGLKSEGSTKLLPPWYGMWTLGSEGMGFGASDYEQIKVDLKMGAAGEEGEGIAALAGYWQTLKEGDEFSGAEWPEGVDVPSAAALYNKIASAACVPDEDADEYLSYIVDSTSVFWVSGANTEERMDLGVKDHILVVVRDYEALGTVAHKWSEEPVWEWTGSDAGGYTRASATFKCANHEKHISTAPAVVRSTDDGEKTTYTATALFNGMAYTDTKVVANIDNEKDLVIKDPDEPAKIVQSVTLNTATVNAKSVKRAIAKAGKKAKITQFVLGSRVKKISSNAFKGTNIRTLVVKSKKLTKKTVRYSLRGSKIKTVNIKVGKKNTNKKYVKKYKKIFTKKNAGKAVKVK